MNIVHVLDKQNVCKIIEGIYNTAKEQNGSRIVFLNTYNPQSTALTPNRFVVNILKKLPNGNEQVVYTSSDILEVPNKGIIYSGVNLFKQNKKISIPLEVWTDITTPIAYW